MTSYNKCLCLQKDETYLRIDLGGRKIGYIYSTRTKNRFEIFNCIMKSMFYLEFKVVQN
jgi:hypothetical protein